MLTAIRFRIDLDVMVQPRPDAVAAARLLLAALPALIEQAEAARGPLRLATYGMRTALVEAQRVVAAADGPGSITSTSDPVRRLSG